MAPWSQSVYDSRAQARLVRTFSYRDDDDQQHFRSIWIDPAYDTVRHMLSGRLGEAPRHGHKTFTSSSLALADLEKKYNKQPRRFPSGLVFTDGNEEMPPMPNRITRVNDYEHILHFKTVLKKEKFAAINGQGELVVAWIDPNDKRRFWYATGWWSGSVAGGCKVVPKAHEEADEETATKLLEENLKKMNEDESFKLINVDVAGDWRVRLQMTRSPTRKTRPIGTVNSRPATRTATRTAGNFVKTYLEQFTIDMTALAREGKIDVILGREEETQKVLCILSRLTKNNAIIIGEPGVGKTTVVEGLARRIADGNIPKRWSRCKILSLDVGSLTAGTKYRGKFEKRITGMLEQIKDSPEDMILFVDEIHLLMSGSGQGAMNAADLLKPMLARGIHCVGATTQDEYRRYIAKDAALARRFQQVIVKEPTISQTIAMLRGVKARYEAHHSGLRILDAAIVTAANQAARYLTDRKLPDLIDTAAAAITVAHEFEPDAPGSLKQECQQPHNKIHALEREKDEASKGHLQKAADAQKGLRAKRQQARRGEPAQADEVGPDQVNEIVACWTGIPVTRLKESEKDKLLHMEEHLDKIVVGQKEAVASVSNAIRLQRSGLSNPNSPPSFLFCGASGTGKTLLTKALAEFLFDDPKTMIRFDMSEYLERHSLSRMIGAPPGYVGHDAGGQLTESLRRRPFSILLFDEVEKAAREVLSVLLQLMDDGRITDGQGRVVDARNCIVVMTSNLGAEFLSRTIDEGTKRELVMGAVRKHFLPEFLNRISSTVIFNRLAKGEIRKLVDLRLGEIQRRLQQNSRDITIKCSKQVKEHIGQSSYSAEYGARPITRTIENEVLNPMVKLILHGHISNGDRAQLVMRDGQIDVLAVRRDVRTKSNRARASPEKI